MLEVDFDASKNLFTVMVPDRLVRPFLSDSPGWRRLPNGTYYAPAWVSSVLLLTPGARSALHWLPKAAAQRDRLLRELQAARHVLAGGTLPLMPTEGWTTARRPLRHQLQAILALRSMGWRALLADDMGLGKTASALWAIQDAGASHLLVICPVSVKYNWRNEIETNLGESWASVVIDGGAKRRAQQFVDAQTYSLAKNTAIIINYDLLRHLPELHLNMLRGFARGNAVVADESHYLKSRDAERTKLVLDIAANAAQVLALTGTPIRNLADDLFTQVELVRPGTWTSYRDFAKRHLVIQTVRFGKRDVQKPVGTKNLDELNAMMNTLQIKRAKTDVLDLPPKVYTHPEIQLEGDQLKLYKAMREFARLELAKLTVPPPCVSCGGTGNWEDAIAPCSSCGGSGKATAPNAVTVFDPRAKSAVEQALRCEQIAQGFIGGIPEPLMARMGDSLKHAEKIEGRPNELVFPHAPKLVWLLETIESVLRQGGAPIVFSRFNAPMIWLNQRLRRDGVRSLVMHGDLSAVDKAGCVTAFQEKACDVLIVQVKIAEGWNATRCQDVLFLGRDWSPAINAQAEDRAHRMGQRGTVNVQIPIVRNTIEMMIHRRLSAKDADAQQALRSLTIEELMEAL